MSEIQLKKAMTEQSALKLQTERLPKVIKTSEASKECVAYCQNTSDPFLIKVEGNAWLKSPGGGCTIV